MFQFFRAIIVFYNSDTLSLKKCHRHRCAVIAFVTNWLNTNTICPTLAMKCNDVGDLSVPMLKTWKSDEMTTLKNFVTRETTIS